MKKRTACVWAVPDKTHFAEAVPAKITAAKMQTVKRTLCENFTQHYVAKYKYFPYIYVIYEKYS